MTREELLSIPRRAQDIADEQNRIEVMKAKLYSPRGLDTSDKVQSSGSQTALADIVIDMEQRLDTKRQELSKLREEAANLIYKADIDDDERVVLALRYTEIMTWHEITSAIHYSIATAYRIHRAALDKLFEEVEA